jgi:flagellar protein FlaH
MPNRSLYVLQGKVGAGKSLISQRLVHGMIENGIKVLVVTTELTTRGWIEQMESVGYGITNAIREGRLMVISRFGTIAESRSDVTLQDVLASPAVPSADVVVFDSASSLMPEDLDEKGRFELVQQMRKVAAEGRSFMLCVDPEEMDQKLLHTLRASAEVVLNLENALIGGEINETSSSQDSSVQQDQSSRVLDGVLNPVWASSLILRRLAEEVMSYGRRPTICQG